MNSFEPTVSVGIPTYNRPHKLQRALLSILAQKYKNIEIIISDNATPNNVTDQVVNQFMHEESRIRYYKQPVNIGTIENFNFVLKHSSGEYFMWAADDDEWSTDFISDCMTAMTSSEREYSAVMTEAQYTNDGNKLPFFSEGKSFYDFFCEDKLVRLKHILKYNYGNLWYSIFRKSALMLNGKTIFDEVKPQFINEIYLFLVVASKGNWLVLPQIGFYKEAAQGAYLQAKWEMVGGELPNIPQDAKIYSNILVGHINYHRHTLKDIFRALEHLNLAPNDFSELKQIAFLSLAKHLWDFVEGKKEWGL